MLYLCLLYRLRLGKRGMSIKGLTQQHKHSQSQVPHAAHASHASHAQTGKFESIKRTLAFFRAEPVRSIETGGRSPSPWPDLHAACSFIHQLKAGGERHTEGRPKLWKRKGKACARPIPCLQQMEANGTIGACGACGRFKAAAHGSCNVGAWDCFHFLETGTMLWPRLGPNLP